MAIILRHIETSIAAGWMLEMLSFITNRTIKLENYLYSGSFEIIAPDDLSEESLYSFSRGGVTNSVEPIPQGNYRVSPVINLSSELARLLKKQAYFDIYMHEPLLKGHELDPFDGSIETIEDLIFYKSNTKDISELALKSIIDRNTLSWHFIMICIKSSDIVYDRISEILISADLIISGIYDGESYMIWRKQ